MGEMKTDILSGIKVIDLTNNLAGPVTCTLLAERGAEVIHIEMPGKGDDSRYFPPVLSPRVTTCYMWANRGKKSITLNLKDKRAIDLIYKMCEDADVLVESYKPGVMDKLGLGYDKIKEINPKLIYCSVSAFGHTGPNSYKPGYDIIAQGYSGLMSLCGPKGGDPMRIGTTIGDFVGAMNGYGSVMAALYHREKMGEGQHIDVSLARGLLWFGGFFNNPINGMMRGRQGNHELVLCPYGVFIGKDGSCVIGAVNEATWARLCKVMKREDLIEHPDFKTNDARVDHKQQVIDLIEDWLKTMPIDDAVEMMDKADVPVSKINEVDLMYKDKHALETGWIQDFPMTEGVKDFETMMGCIGLTEFSKANLNIAPAPALGANNMEIMTKYGMTEEEVNQCLEDWSKKR